MAKMTEAMLSALSDLEREPSSAYEIGCSLGTIRALERRGYARCIPGPGNFAFPHTATWRITPAGRAALTEGKDG